jgi:hypothetical protein
MFRSTRSQAKGVFVVLTGVMVAVSLVLIDLAPRFGGLAEEVAIVPLFLTAWIGAAFYRRRFGGRFWQQRVPVVMAGAGILGGVGALVALMSWTDWPSIGSVFFWGTAVLLGSALFGVASVPLMWLSDRRLHRIRLKRRHRTGRPSSETEQQPDRRSAITDQEQPKSTSVSVES